MRVKEAGEQPCLEHSDCSGRLFWVTERGFHCILQLSYFALKVREMQSSVL